MVLKRNRLPWIPERGERWDAAYLRVKLGFHISGVRHASTFQKAHPTEILPSVSTNANAACGDFSISSEKQEVSLGDAYSVRFETAYQIWNIDPYLT